MSRRIQTKNSAKATYTPKDHLKEALAKPKNVPTQPDSHIKAFVVILLIVVLIGMTSMGFFSQRVPPVNDIDYENEVVEFDTSSIEVTMYTSPSCGCCHIWAEYLEDYDITIFTIKTSAYVDEKVARNIPTESFSCHTADFGDYFVEGHVPMTAINKLLTELPDIDGIALPDMPSGSPGMSGPKTETFHIQAIKDGQVVYTFMSI